ncbi:unnamed protein product [Tilletia controversa]|nr:unnamed protein product [Tilletia controversa]
MTIKLWEWDKNWRHVQGHPHSIMNLAFNPKDSNTFASSCLDRTIVDVKGGNLLGVIGTGFVCFYDWESGALVRRIDVDARNLAAIVGEDSFYILAYNADAYATALDAGEAIEDEGVEDAFEVVTEISDTARTARWTGDATRSLVSLRHKTTRSSLCK